MKFARIATWNVERVKPHGWKIAPAQRRRIAEVGADIWVLTETHVDFTPGNGCVGVHSPPHPERRPVDERWAAVWSRFPIDPIVEPAPHRRGSVAALVHAPAGDLIVYGCVIAWANEREFDDGSLARMWEVHLAELDRIDRELAQIRAGYPGVPIVMAGDFNQDRDGSGWYGTKAGRDRLTQLLESNDLVCVTEEDVDASGMLPGRHLIDHICVSRSLATGAEMTGWDSTDDDGIRLSDHPTVAVDL